MEKKKEYLNDGIRFFVGVLLVSLEGLLFTIAIIYLDVNVSTGYFLFGFPLFCAISYFILDFKKTKPGGD